MATNYITGYSYPVIVVKDYNTNAEVATINLDLCMADGLRETYEENFRRIELITGEYVTYDNRGCRIVFTLDYSSYIKKANMFLIEQIFHYASLPESYKLYLYPRADNTLRYFEVLLLDGNYELGIHKGGMNTIGGKYPVIKFVTKNLTSKMFSDIDENYFPINIKSE